MFLVGIDTGGTFTDLVVMDDTRSLDLYKSLSTPRAPEGGVFNVLKLGAEDKGMSLQHFLQDTQLLVLGTTIVTNAVIARSRAKTALLTNAGYEDMLMFGLGSKGKPPSDMFRTHQDYPEPIIPRHFIEGIRGRINAEGGIETEIDEEQVRRIVRDFKDRSVESIAVSLLWSIVNPQHEDRVAQIIAEEHPEANISIGHQISSVVREYERTSTCSLDATVKPLFARFVDRLLVNLKENGYTRELLMVNSHGGVMDAEELARYPVYALKSGPSLGPAAGLTVSQHENTGHDLIICDMGGTSFDVSMVVQGEVITTMSGQVGPYHYTLPTLDVHSIGAGGGSIASVDSGGLVHVGPQSAGSSPGPACYGLGGDKPTVTDANVVLGYISPDYFMGGTMEISADLAAKAVKRHIADPLKISVEAAAGLIYATVNQNMVLGLSEVSIQKGIDPRGFLVVAGGGCSPAHIVPIARELGIKDILIPKISPVLCAFGMLAADLLYEKARSLITTSDYFVFDQVNATLSSLLEDADQFLSRAEVPPSERQLSFSVMAAYPYQSLEIEVPLPWDQVTEENLPELIELFNRAHNQTYGFTVADEPVKFVSWRVKAVGLREKPVLKEVTRASNEDARAAQKGQRNAYFVESRGFVDTAVYAGDQLAAGSRISGPAIVEEPATTVVVPQGNVLTVTKYGNYLIEPQS